MNAIDVHEKTDEPQETLRDIITSKFDHTVQKIDGFTEMTVVDTNMRANSINIPNTNLLLEEGIFDGYFLLAVYLKNEAGIPESGIPLNPLLPPGYNLYPDSYFKKPGDEKNKKPLTAQELMNRYTGAYTNSEGNFSHISFNELRCIKYGNLTRTGDRLALLHEIGHAWDAHWSNHYNFQFLKIYMRKLCKFLEAYCFNQELLYYCGTYSWQKKTIAKIKVLKKRLLRMGVKVIPREDMLCSHKFSNRVFIRFIGRRIKDYKITSGLSFSDISSKVLINLFRSMVWSERHAWALAIKLLRTLRKNGFDLEPELKSCKDIKKHVHAALATYEEYWGSTLHVGGFKELAKKNCDPKTYIKNSNDRKRFTKFFNDSNDFWNKMKELLEKEAEKI